MSRADVKMKKRSQSIEKTTETRRKIILAALTLFNHSGFAKTKIAAIADHAGVGKGTIYSYFETKEKLFEGVVDYLIQETYQPIQYAELPDGESVHAFILKNMLPGMKNIEQAGRADIARLVLSEGKIFTDILALYRKKIYESGLLELEKLIRLAKQRGELSVTTCESTTAALIIAPIWLGIIHNGLLLPESPLNIQKMFEINLKSIFAA